MSWFAPRSLKSLLPYLKRRPPDGRNADLAELAELLDDDRPMVETILSSNLGGEPTADARHPGELWKAPEHMMKVTDKDGRLVAWKDPHTGQHYHPYSGEAIARPANADPPTSAADAHPVYHSHHPGARIVSTVPDPTRAALQAELQALKAATPLIDTSGIRLAPDPPLSPQHEAALLEIRRRLDPAGVAAEEAREDDARVGAFIRARQPRATGDVPPEIDMQARHRPGPTPPRFLASTDGGPSPGPIAFPAEPDPDEAWAERSARRFHRPTPADVRPAAGLPLMPFGLVTALPGAMPMPRPPAARVPEIEETLRRTAVGAGLDPDRIELDHARAVLAGALERDGLASVRHWVALAFRARSGRLAEIDATLAAMGERLRDGGSSWLPYRDAARVLLLERAGIDPLAPLGVAIAAVAPSFASEVARAIDGAGGPQAVATAILDATALDAPTGPDAADASRLKTLDERLARVYDPDGRLAVEIRAERDQLLGRIEEARALARSARARQVEQLVKQAAVGNDHAFRDLLAAVEKTPAAFDPKLLPALRGAPLAACEQAGVVALADALA